MTRGRAGFRIVIVDSIDDCNPSSANALLKTLEEPPDYLKFVLATTDPQKVPVTVPRAVPVPTSAKLATFPVIRPAASRSARSSISTRAA